ncbi:hypothetical protein RFI_06101, partial [Reticulomyxa filosa]
DSWKFFEKFLQDKKPILRRLRYVGYILTHDGREPLPNAFREHTIEDIVRPFQFEPLMDANEYEQLYRAWAEVESEKFAGSSGRAKYQYQYVPLSDSARSTSVNTVEANPTNPTTTGVANNKTLVTKKKIKSVVKPTPQKNPNTKISSLKPKTTGLSSSVSKKEAQTKRNFFWYGTYGNTYGSELYGNRLYSANANIQNIATTSNNSNNNNNNNDNDNDNENNNSGGANAGKSSSVDNTYDFDAPTSMGLSKTGVGMMDIDDEDIDMTATGSGGRATGLARRISSGLQNAMIAGKKKRMSGGGGPAGGGSSKKSKFEQTVSRYLDLARNDDGTVRVPFQIRGGCTVTCLGTIVYDRTGFSTSKYIWPVGFQSTRMHPSYLDPSVRVTVDFNFFLTWVFCLEKFTSTILEGPNGAQFEVVAEDDPENPLVGGSASNVWTTIIKRVATMRADSSKRKTCTVSGPEMFGFSDAVIQALIEELPNADKCADYWKNRQSFKDKMQEFGFA